MKTRILQINENIGNNSESIINISTNEGTVKFIYLFATFPDSTPARAEYHIILDDIETDITDYIQNPAKSEISLEYSSTAKLKIINPNGSDIVVKGYAVFEEVRPRPTLYLVHGEFPGTKTQPYTGLYYDTSPPVLASGVYTDITKMKDVEDRFEITTKPVNKIYLVKQGWLDFRASADVRITYRVIYPYCTYWSGTVSRLFYKFQDYMVYAVSFENPSTTNINATVKLLNQGHDSITFNNVGSGVSHTIYIPKWNKLIRVKDISKFLLGEVEV